MKRWPGPLYSIRVVHNAPLAFTFRWCTDYSKRDPVLFGEDFERKVVEGQGQHRIFEDLYSSPEGWSWGRWEVTLRPPDQWHADSVGNYLDWSADYQLKPLGQERTEFRAQFRRRAGPLGGKNPSKGPYEKALTDMWRHLGRALERDYRHRKRR
jgi:hypothetical protein